MPHFRSLSFLIFMVRFGSLVGLLLVLSGCGVEGKPTNVEPLDKVLYSGPAPEGLSSCDGFQVVSIEPGQTAKEAIVSHLAAEGKTLNDVAFYEQNRRIKAPSEKFTELTQVPQRVQGMGVSVSSSLTVNRQAVVAVTDGGVDVNHIELKDWIYVNSGEIPGNGIDDDGNGFIDDVNGYSFAPNNGGSSVQDTNNHGTHVSGIVKRTAEALGMSSSDLKIMPVKFMNTGSDGTLEGALRSIGYAVRNGADVINASWGSYGYSEFLDHCVQAAVAEGVTFVAAAGNGINGTGVNNDSYPIWPARVTGAISVAAIMSVGGNLTSFSNYGVGSVHLGALGYQIESTIPGNQYGVMSGTSMAAPAVAGAVATLIATADSKPTTSEITTSLVQGAAANTYLAGKVISGGELSYSGSKTVLDSIQSTLP